MSPAAIPYIALLGFFFGSTLVVSRFSVGQYDPTTYIGLRLLIATAAHIAVYTFSRRHWPRDRQLWRLAVPYGIIGTAVPMVAIVSGLQYLSSGIAAILVTTNPAFVALMAHFLLDDERLTLRKAAGVLLALGGAALLALRGESGLIDARGTPVGYALLITAALVGSLATIFARRYLRHYNAFDVASIRMGTAAVAVMPLSLLFVGFDLTAVDRLGYSALIYAALIGTFFGMILNFYNVKRFGALASSATSYLIPIVATIGGVLLLEETLTVWMLVGMAVILLGISLLQEKKVGAAITLPKT